MNVVIHHLWKHTVHCVAIFNMYVTNISVSLFALLQPLVVKALLRWLLNTALALSKNNNKVLLVDGNLRNPTQHIAFNVQNKGLTNAVMMDEDLTIHRNVVPHLDVLTAGEVVEYPSDIVDSSKLPAIFEYVRDEYDVVIIDTPPVLSVTDAVVLAEKSDGVVLVVKNEVASPKDLIEAKKRLSQVEYFSFRIYSN